MMSDNCIWVKICVLKMIIRQVLKKHKMKLFKWYFFSLLTVISNCMSVSVHSCPLLPLSGPKNNFSPIFWLRLNSLVATSSIPTAAAARQQQNPTFVTKRKYPAGRKIAYVLFIYFVQRQFWIPYKCWSLHQLLEQLNGWVECRRPAEGKSQWNPTTPGQHDLLTSCWGETIIGSRIESNCLQKNLQKNWVNQCYNVMSLTSVVLSKWCSVAGFVFKYQYESHKLCPNHMHSVHYCS